MTRKKIAVLLTVMTLSGATCFAATDPAAAGFTYANDSDGITTHSFKLSTATKDKPLSFDLYRTRIKQGSAELNGTTFVAKAQRPLSDNESLTLWGGYTTNKFNHFVPAAVMYNSRNKTGALWLAVGREAIETVAANTEGLYYNTASASYLHKTGQTTIVLDAKQYHYSDSNRRKSYSATVSQSLSSRLQAGIRYTYTDADFASPGTYYVPQGESVVSFVPEWIVPLGKNSNLLLTGEFSLTAHDKTGSIHRRVAEAGIEMKSLYIGTKYYRSGDYWSRTYRLNYSFPL